MAKCVSVKQMRQQGKEMDPSRPTGLDPVNVELGRIDEHQDSGRAGQVEIRPGKKCVGVFEIIRH